MDSSKQLSIIYTLRICPQTSPLSVRKMEWKSNSLIFFLQSLRSSIGEMWLPNVSYHRYFVKRFNTGNIFWIVLFAEKFSFIKPTTTKMRTSPCLIDAFIIIIYHLSFLAIIISDFKRVTLHASSKNYFYAIQKKKPFIPLFFNFKI